MMARQSRPAARAARWTGAVCLVIVALVLWVASIGAVFARNQVLNTDRFVSTMAPLADDPVVQQAVATRISDEILTNVDLTDLANQAATWLQDRGAPPLVDALVAPAVNAVESFVRSEVSKFVASSAFEAVWDTALRAGHTAVVDVLTGSNIGPVSTAGNAITIDLGQVLATVKEKLVDEGFGLASKIPDVSLPYTLFTSDRLPEIRSYVKLLDRVATWLPWVALLVAVAAVFTAPNRRRGIVLTGLVLGIGLLIIREVVHWLVSSYLNDLPTTIQSPAALRQVITIVLRNVRTAISFLSLLALIAAAFALLAGPSRLATQVRRLVNVVLDAAARGLVRTGVPLDDVPKAVARYRRWAAPIAIVIAAIVLVFNPSLGAIGWAVFWVLLSLAIVEIIARATPPSTPAPVESPAAAPPP